jgi:hypothetical protein
MKATEIIEKLRAAFAELTGAQPPVPPAPPAPPAPQVFGYKLADGTEIEVSGEVAPGSVVTIQGVPAPAGEHVLEDGTKIEVAEGGVITEVEVPEPAEPAVDEEMKKKQLMSAVQKFATGTPEERLTNLEFISKMLFEYAYGWELREQAQKQVKDQAMAIYQQMRSEEKTDDRVKQLETTVNKYREMFAQMLELTEALAKAPVAPADPAVQKDQFAAQPKDWAHAASQLVTKKTK